MRRAAAILLLTAALTGGCGDDAYVMTSSFAEPEKAEVIVTQPGRDSIEFKMIPRVEIFERRKGSRLRASVYAGLYQGATAHFRFEIGPRGGVRFEDSWGSTSGSDALYRELSLAVRSWVFESPTGGTVRLHVVCSGEKPVVLDLRDLHLPPNTETDRIGLCDDDNLMKVMR